MKRLELNSLASLLLVLFVATAVQGQQSEEPDGFALPEAGVKSVSPAVQVEMELAEHRVLSWPFHVTRIFLADDTLVKLEPMTPSKVRLRALKSGSTKINVWGENGVAQAYDILIHAPITELQKILKEEFSESKITVRQVAASVMLSGEVAEQNARENIESVARQFFPRVINNLKLKLQASIFEVSHYDLKQHDLKWPLEASRKGEMQHEVLATKGAVAEFLQSAYEKKLLRKIATPLITTVEGRRAAFETGGQMPLVIASGSQGGRVRLQQWGVRMKINQIDVAKAIRVESVSLPGIRTHQNDLLVDLGEGESLMLYGMPMERVIREKEDLPLLSDLPLLGESFYKTNKIDDKVELFIIISPAQTPGEKVAASE